MTLPKITHPSHAVKVPSTGQLIRIRPFVVKEEKILLTAKESGEDRDILAAVRQIVLNVVVEPADFDVDKITTFDLEYIFLRSRAVSVSNLAEVSYRDNSDNKVYDFKVNLDEVQVIFPDPPANPVIDLGDQIGMKLKWPSAKLYADQNLLGTEGADVLENLVIRSIDSIWEADRAYNPTDASDEELKEWLETVDSKAWGQVVEFFTKVPRLEYVIKYKNSKDEDRTIPLTSLRDFFHF